MKRPFWTTLATLLVGALMGSLLAAVPAVAGPAAPALAADAARAQGRPAVVERRVLGYTTRGRAIKAWRLGEPGKPKYVVISTMHGDERQTRLIATSLRDGRRIKGIDLWVIPLYNPDGYAQGTRKNGRSVDLNRNFPHNWADLDGSYESGRGPSSEPETRAMINFLSEIKPRRIVSFHQPLNGVDVNTKRPAFARKLARALRLPKTSLNCGGVCHGTMTSWYNANFKGAALTVEYGYRPTRQRMKKQAPRALLRVLGGRRVRRS